MQTKENLLSTLINIGLTEKEAEIYLLGLELGPTTILNISKYTNINRSTIYTITDSLIKKGLMSIEVRGFKKVYSPEAPERLESIFEQKKAQLSKTLPIFYEIYQKEANQSFIKYYEGIDSIKLVYANILKEVKSGDDYLVIGNQESWFSIDPEFFSKFIQKRAKLKVKIRLLFQDSPIAQKHKKLEKNLNQQIKILPPNTSLTTNMVILPKKIIIHQLTGPKIAVVIENQNIVKMNRELFEIIWNSIS